MKYVKNYTQFNEELNLRKAAVIGGIAAGMAFGNPTMGQNQTGLPVVDQTEQTEVKDVENITIPVNATDFGTIKNYDINQGESITITTTCAQICIGTICPGYPTEDLGDVTNTQPYTLVTSGNPKYENDFEIICVARDGFGNPTLICHVMIHVTTASINDIESDNYNFSIYPNPATDVINIKSDISGNYQIIGINGKVLINTIDKSINISELKPGEYFLRVGNSTKLFIKN